MNTVHTRILWFFFLAFADSSEVKLSQTFVKSIIEKWQLLAPTLIVQDNMQEICLSLEWGLCLTTDMSIDELAQQLAVTHKPRKQDGILFIGRQGHEDLIKGLAYRMPSLFTSDNPLFMSMEYTKYISLRLDSNIIFYENEFPGIYKLVDIFAVKGGPPIAIPVGYWNIDKGIILKESINRWKRRTDLKGADFYNCVWFYATQADFIKDENGTIIGTKGYFQEVLFYITEKLNLNVVTVESTNCLLFMNCTCFDPKADVDATSSGLPIPIPSLLNITSLVELPLAIIRVPTALFAAKPKGTAPNMWVYIQVFRISPWIVYIVLLTLLGMALVMKSGLLGKDYVATISKKNSSVNQRHEVFSNFCLVYIYAIQMGNHPNSKILTSRMVTLTTSMVTLVMFTYFASQTTSEMTSGPPDIPVRTFDDIIYHDYKVIAQGAYWEKLLHDAQPGTAKKIVYNFYLRKIDRTTGNELEVSIEIFKKAQSDSKTLVYTSSIATLGYDYPPYQELIDQMRLVKLDDAQFAMATVGLQKDSEFLQIVNHYIVKQTNRKWLSEKALPIQICATR